MVLTRIFKNVRVRRHSCSLLHTRQSDAARSPIKRIPLSLPRNAASQAESILQLFQRNGRHRHLRHFQGTHPGLSDIQRRFRVTPLRLHLSQESLPKRGPVIGFRQHLFNLARQPRQNRLKLPHDALKKVDPRSSDEVYIGLHRPLVSQVNNPNARIPLAEPVSNIMISHMPHHMHKGNNLSVLVGHFCRTATVELLFK